MHRFLPLTRSRIAGVASISCRTGLPKSFQWATSFAGSMQQRHQTNTTDKSSDIFSNESLLDGQQGNHDLNQASPADASASTGKTPLEILTEDFKKWTKQQTSKHTTEQVDRALAYGPPRSNAMRNAQLPGESDPDSILNTNFDRPGSAVGRFDNPFSNKRTIETPLARWENEVRLMDSSLHMGIQTGRQVDVIQTNPTDLGAKLNLLGALVSRNKIKHTMVMQRFHERPGLKRKRLKRERWRKRFAGSFASICKRATSLASQGW